MEQPPPQSVAEADTFAAAANAPTVPPSPAALALQQPVRRHADLRHAQPVRMPQTVSRGIARVAQHEPRHLG